MKKKSVFWNFMIAIVMAVMSVGFASCGGDDEDLPEGWSKVSGIYIKYDIYKEKYTGDESFDGYIHNNKLYSTASEDATPIGSVSSNNNSKEGTYDVSGYSYYTRYVTNRATQYWLYYYNKK